MRRVPTEMTNRWKDSLKIGTHRPVVRATIQKVHQRKYEYDTALAEGGNYDTDRHRRGLFTSMVMGEGSPVVELRNVASYNWTRSLDQDVATCTLTLKNVEAAPIGNVEEGENPLDFDMPGYFTYNRGETKVSVSRWAGYDQDSGWEGRIVPDRVVRTYEGYGADTGQPPALDPNLVQSGVWLIDKVTYSSDGEVTLEMRDLGRLLLDQIVFPPVVPFSEYPLIWEHIETRLVPGRDAKGGTWGEAPRGTTADSSNDYFIGQGLTNEPFKNYVGPQGGVNGHHANDALKNWDKEFWLSTGQPSWNSKVWWQANFKDPQNLAAVRIQPWGGPYRIYISIKTDKGWVGRKKVPYDNTKNAGDIDIQAGVPFVTAVHADRQNAFDVILPRKYKNVKAVRLTFSSLMNHRLGEYPWSAALQDVLFYTADNFADLHFEKGKVAKVVGNYRDYTDLVKWAAAWGGFFWPQHKTDDDFVQLWSPPRREGETYAEAWKRGRQYITYDLRDTTLPVGRVWGDFMRSGTYAEAALTMDTFDKQPLMNIINYVRDILGFVFFVDELGGIIWRMPNLGMAGDPKLGNYVSPATYGQWVRKRTSDIVTIDEEETLISYSTTLNSEQLRERIFIANVTGKIGTVIRGFNPYPVGMRRIAGWTDQHFEKKRETRVMADMISARQMFEYRRAQVTIPGYPAIQIDDQIRIFERVTNETYYHYVLGISSTLDNEEGTWEYTLDTHWLGERPQDAWVVKVDQMDKVTQSYLNLMNQANGAGDISSSSGVFSTE